MYILTAEKGFMQLELKFIYIQDNTINYFGLTINKILTNLTHFRNKYVFYLINITMKYISFCFLTF